MSGSKAFVVCISGAVPALEEDVFGRWGESDIRLLVKRLANRIYDRGWTLAHGSHPTFTSIIATEAHRAASRGRASGKDPTAKGVLLTNTKMFAAKTFFDQDRLEEFVARHAGVAEVFPVAEFDTEIPAALTELRARMIEGSSILVAVGGMLHRDGKRRPGVAEEIELALDAGLPVIPLGGFGGYVSEMMGVPERRAAVTEHLREVGVSDDAIQTCETEVDPWRLVSTVMGILDSIAKARGVARRPGRLARWSSMVAEPPAPPEDPTEAEEGVKTRPDLQSPSQRRKRKRRQRRPTDQPILPVAATTGEWINVPGRVLGLRFRGPSVAGRAIDSAADFAADHGVEQVAVVCTRKRPRRRARRDAVLAELGYPKGAEWRAGGRYRVFDLAAAAQISARYGYGVQVTVVVVNSQRSEAAPVPPGESQ